MENKIIIDCNPKSSGWLAEFANNLPIQELNLLPFCGHDEFTDEETIKNFFNQKSNNMTKIKITVSNKGKFQSQSIQEEDFKGMNRRDIELVVDKLIEKTKDDKEILAGKIYELVKEYGKITKTEPIIECKDISIYQEVNDGMPWRNSKMVKDRMRITIEL